MGYRALQPARPLLHRPRQIDDHYFSRLIRMLVICGMNAALWAGIFMTARWV